MTTALVFPGQGSQSVGMGKALAEAFPAAREVSSSNTYESSTGDRTNRRKDLASGGKRLSERFAHADAL